MNAPLVSEHGSLLESIDTAQVAVEEAHIDAGLCNSYHGDAARSHLQGCLALLRLARERAKDGKRDEDRS